MNLEQVIQNSKIPVLVEFWSSWCLPCQMMQPILIELEQEYKDKIKIIKINADMNPRLAVQYNIKGLPALILFKNKQEIKKEIGARSKDEIYEILNQCQI